MPLARERPKSLTGIRVLDEITRGRLLPARSQGLITRQPDPHEPTDTLRARLTEAEEMLRAMRLCSAEGPYRNLVEQMQEGAVVLTGRGDILYANARFAALVGEPLESVVGSRIDRFVPASEKDDFETLLGAGSGRRRSRLIGSDAGVFDVSLSLTTNGDRLSLIVADSRELLEANSERDRAEHDSRTKDEFLVLLAHELRNPLGAISNAVRVLEWTDAGGEAATSAREMIARHVGHIAHLIDDLLDVERVVSGKIQLNRQPLDMADAVRRAVATFSGDARLGRHIVISTEPVWVDGDAVRLEQVLTNIVTNAVKYTPPNGQIQVTLCADGSDAVVSIEDTGFGISPALLPFIFDMYVQADRTLDHAQGGLGIGLTLVRRLVELHGGTIVASSAGEGHGSRFTVRLRQVPAGVEAAGLSFPSERRVTPRRVLLIEDSADVREMMRMMLQFAGHVVYDAADGARGLELLNVVRPDVGIIDISLPRMDGYQVAQRIREEPHGRDMLLLALTGYGSAGETDRSSERGFNYHLVKPVDPDQLARLLSEGADAFLGTSP